MYYVGFSTSTLVASLILFQGFNTTDATNTVSLLSGFIVTFLGVHLLNLSRTPETPLFDQHHSTLEGGLLNPRLSLQGRMSLDGWTGTENGHPPTPSRMNGHGRRSSLYRAQSTTLFNAFEEEEVRTESMGLHQLSGVHESEEEDEDDDADERTRLRGKAVAKGKRAVDEQRRSGSRSHSHSPNPPNMNDIRISPRQS